VTRRALLAFVPALTGCLPLPIPHRVAVQPGLTGRIVDEHRVPISGADIELRAGDALYSAQSGQDGRFRIDPVVEWRYVVWLPLVPIDYFHGCSPAEVSVKRGDRIFCGIAPKICGVVPDESPAWAGEHLGELGDIPLCPAKES